MNRTAPYRNVYFEISGRCNARCKYCVTGQENLRHAPVGKFVDCENFKKAMLHLRRSGIVCPDANFGLYNWGEPFMHPQFKEIIEFLAENDFCFSLSTNGAIPLPEFTNKIAFKKLAAILFSCCGFSQTSYNHIHKFDLEKIKRNFTQIIRKIRAYGFNGDASMSYHVYQFNIDEIAEADSFCQSVGIGFTPYYAIINDFERGISYFSNENYKKEEKQIERDLFLPYFADEIRQRRPQDYHCPQFDYLTIDENLNILTCCGHKTPHYGNILNVKNMNELQTALSKRSTKCQECQASAWDFLVHNVPQYHTQHQQQLRKIIACNHSATINTNKPLENLIDQLATTAISHHKKLPIVIYIPVYNEVRYLEKTIESALRQNVEEIIISDNNSNDGTTELLRQYRQHPNIKIIHSSVTGTAIENSLRCLVSTQQPYSLFLGGHDLLPDDHIKKLYQALIATPEAVLAYSDVETISDEQSNKQIYTFPHKEILLDDQPLNRVLHLANCLSDGSMWMGLVKRTLMLNTLISDTQIPKIDFFVLGFLLLQGKFVFATDTRYLRRNPRLPETPTEIAKRYSKVFNEPLSCVGCFLNANNIKSMNWFCEILQLPLTNKNEVMNWMRQRYAKCWSCSQTLTAQDLSLN